jgi:hypothetical protein
MFITGRGVFTALLAALLAVVPLVALAEADDAPIVPSAERVAQSGGTETGTARPKLWDLGWEYTADGSIAWPFGKTGQTSKFGLVGGADIIIKYALSPNNRFVVGYYDLQEYPVGFSSGVVPVFLQGVATPIGTQDLSAAPGPLNAAIKNRVMITHFDQTIWIKQKLPVIISPTYTQRWGTVGGGTDLIPVEIDGLPQTLHFRTGSWIGLFASLPLCCNNQDWIPGYRAPRASAVYTIGPQWATGANGANVSNKAQLVQILLAKYHPLKQLEIFAEPSLYPNLLPTDKWPQHYFTAIYGGSYKFGTTQASPFVQAVVSMGGAMNVSPYGVSALFCQQLPCTSLSQVVPAIGGNHAAQFQLKFGIGVPEVLPL